MRRISAALLPALVLSAALGGCRARPDPGAPPPPFQFTVRNEGPDIHQLEVDYPSASFGRDYLKSGASFNYVPKLIGSGPVKVMFNDSAGKSHAATGPVINESARSTLVISIGEDESVVFEALPPEH
ncbi:MAG: hypothetical protein JWM54_626 [Acidobacteriaceae bacterium]|nr:hypothetical protein [Acidobacteriaceae bacterium]